jgi:hypothetical protein
MTLKTTVLSALTASLVLAIAGPTQAGSPSVTTYSVPSLPLGQVSFPGGKTLDWSVGIGSAAYHAPFEGEDIIYTLTDRGPNIKCKDAEKTTGVSVDKMCNGDKKSKIFPMPSFQPQILKFKLTGDKAEVVETIKLKGRSGKPILGLTNGLKITNTEKSYSNEGKLLDYTANGLDTEGLVKLKDGSFWISEEYGGSIAHVAADGTVKTRYVPKGMEADLGDADYDVKGTLPAIIMKRKLNRGIESLAVSPDEKFLYFSMQSPLANPNAKAYKASKNVRVYKFDIAAEKVVGEWLYVMDDATSFIKDNEKKKRKPSHVKISELVYLADEKLLLLERVSKTTKFYLIDLAGTATIPVKFDDIATQPTLTQTAADQFASEGLVPLKKVLVLDTDSLPGKPVKKIEGIALLNDREMVLVNDNDFGLGGATEMFKVSFDKPIIDAGK